MSETLLVREGVPQNYLLVEGDDDAQVLYHLLMRHKIHEQVAIKNKGGIENLLGTPRTELKGSGEIRLGIITLSRQKLKQATSAKKLHRPRDAQRADRKPLA